MGDWKIALKRSLTRLPKNKSLAFAVLQCERSMPMLSQFGNEVAFDVSIYRKCLDRAWDALYGNEGPSTYGELATRCFDAAPDTEDYDHSLVSASLNAALSIGEVMEFLSDQDVNHIVEVASLGLETAALRGQEASGIPPRYLSFWEMVQHPFVVKEQTNQSEDLRFLELLPVGSQDMAALVKARAVTRIG